MTNHRVLFREWCNLPLNQHIRIIKNGEQAPDNKMYFAQKTALPIPIKANISLFREYFVLFNPERWRNKKVASITMTGT